MGVDGSGSEEWRCSSLLPCYPVKRKKQNPEKKKLKPWKKKDKYGVI